MFKKQETVILIIATIILLYHASLHTDLCLAQVSINPIEFLNVCPGEEVRVTCRTTGSQILAWSSVEYIGMDGSQLEFLGGLPPGSNLTSANNNDTIATLLNNTVENGRRILVSQIRIIVSSEYPTSRVYCINVGNDDRKFATITSLVDPDVPPNVISQQSVDENGKCIVQLSWSFPSNIDHEDVSHFTVHINGTHIANETRKTNESFILAAYPLCICASHDISIGTINRCGQPAQNAFNITVQNPPKVDNIACPADNTASTMPSAMDNKDKVTICSNECFIAIIVLLGLSVLINIIAFIAAVIICWRHKQKQGETNGKKIEMGDMNKNVD